MTGTEKTIGQNLKRLPHNRAIHLDNITCVYCSTALNKDTTTREHVIGRRFVPKMKLHGYWNLIVNACRACNGTKSDLEDDISAITMQPDAFGRHAHDDVEAMKDGQRKAQKAVSRRTKKPVKDSSEQMTIEVSFAPGITMSFSLTGPAQTDQRRVFGLARLQLMAFFYWITYDKSTRRGRFWQEGFYPVFEARRSDWGNPVHQAFMEAVVGWEPCVLASNADGFYKVAIRKHPSAACWSWALEWNHAMRVAGFFGEKQAAQAVAAQFPKLELKTVSTGPDHVTRRRREIPLDEGDDKLFYWDDGAH